MFWNRKNKATIEALNTRILHNAERQADDHNDLQELSVQVEALKIANSELVNRVAELESRQHNLREGLVRLGALDVDGPSTPRVYIDTPD